MPQTEEQKIRSRLRSYERKLEKEKKEHGFYRDGAGKRYQVGPHYMLLDDNDGARSPRSSGSRRNSLTILVYQITFCAGASLYTVRATRSVLLENFVRRCSATCTSCRAC